MTSPKTLTEAVRFYSDPDRCLAEMVNARWPNGVVRCPMCGRDDVRFIATRRLWECKTDHERQQFSAKVGTIFEDSPLGLDKWLTAVWLIANAKNGISSYEIGRAIGITQKSAWFMMHRIRAAIHTGTFAKVSGDGEADETYIGGKARFMHPWKRAAKIKGTGPMGKTAVMGLLERHTGGRSKVIAKVIGSTRKKALQAEVRQNVQAGGTRLYTDALASYDGLTEYDHHVIDHAEAYVRGNVHTNGMENFWSLLKRCIKGTYVSVAPFHLGKYLDEEAFRFNERKDTDGGRFAKVLSGVSGKRLTYAALTGKTLGLSPA